MTMDVPKMHFGGAVRMKVDPDYFLSATDDELFRRGEQMAREGVEAFRDLQLADAEPVPEAQLEHFEYFDPAAGEQVIAWRILCRRKSTPPEAMH
jgi:hypothetical protein